MLKLPNREMKFFTGFFIVGLCIGLHGGAVANVATTAGSNLTAFNGTGATNNNNWNSFANARGGMDDNLATANFGNCNAVILRCATPRCKSGCATMELARPIVAGCVNSNETCRVHGNDLIESIAAQVVAQSTAKAEAARNAAEIAAAQASASQQSSNAQVEALQQQLANMQSQMQSSISSVQSQVQQQGAASAAAIEAANARASAAESIVNPVANYEGLTDLERIALQNGVGTEVLEREKITGQIVTSVEEAELAVQKMKKVMNDLFEYAGCDNYANECTGPRRVKRFKDLANEFFTPYDEVGDKLYDALVMAMTVGVDVSDALMLLNDSCNMWGYYVCDACTQEESLDNRFVVSNIWMVNTISRQTTGDKNCVCMTKANGDKTTNCYWRPEKDENGKVSARQPHCRLVNMISGDNNPEVKRAWIENTTGTSGAERVECASDVIFSSGLFKKRNKKASIEDIETLQRLVNQDAYRTCRKASDGKYENCGQNYCNVNGSDNPERMERLRQSAKQKKLLGKYCYNKDSEMNDSKGELTGKNNCEEDTYFAPEYALCTVHAYNVGKTQNPSNSADTEEMKEVIALKSTIIAQQIKEQYDMINAIVRRLKTQLEKSVYATKMDILSGADSGASYSSGAASSGMAIDGVSECQYKSLDEKYECFAQNMIMIIHEPIMSKANAQLKKDFQNMVNLSFGGNISENLVKEAKAEISSGKCSNYKNNGGKGYTQKKAIDACAELWRSILQDQADNNKKQNTQGGGMFMMPVMTR
ncbi:MAG: hypothetical protein IJR92_00060 [Alphaproteobacteria bacterium]|nr:hypothetical protein [Alphaproteobacteria bacterium]